MPVGGAEHFPHSARPELFDDLEAVVFPQTVAATRRHGEGARHSRPAARRRPSCQLSSLAGAGVMVRSGHLRPPDSALTGSIQFAYLWNERQGPLARTLKNLPLCRRRVGPSKPPLAAWLPAPACMRAYPGI